MPSGKPDDKGKQAEGKNEVDELHVASAQIIDYDGGDDEEKGNRRQDESGSVGKGIFHIRAARTMAKPTARSSKKRLRDNIIFPAARARRFSRSWAQMNDFIEEPRSRSG